MIFLLFYISILHLGTTIKLKSKRKLKNKKLPAPLKSELQIALELSLRKKNYQNGKLCRNFVSKEKKIGETTLNWKMVESLTFSHFSVCITLKEPEQKIYGKQSNFDIIRANIDFWFNIHFESFPPFTFTSALLLNLIPCVVFLSSGHKWRLNEFYSVYNNLKLEHCVSLFVQNPISLIWMLLILIRITTTCV